jgi:tol-pal system protein YbgF
MTSGAAMKFWMMVAGVAMGTLVCAVATVSAAAAGRHEGYVQVAGLFGQSDEEKAAMLAAEQRENDQDAAIVDMRQRVGDLERSLQQITGQNELLNHRVQEMQTALDTQKKAFDYKLCTLTAQLMGVGGTADAGGIDCNGSGASAAATQPMSDETKAVRQAYDAAMGFLARAQYDEARAAFSALVEAHPKDDLAPQAVYWVGNIAYVQKDFASAARSFAEVLKLYPKSSRAPESMLKLGQTLLALGQQKEGCQTLEALKRRYPKAPADTINQAARTRSASCL